MMGGTSRGKKKTRGQLHEKTLGIMSKTKTNYICGGAHEEKESNGLPSLRGGEEVGNWYGRI